MSDGSPTVAQVREHISNLRRAGVSRDDFRRVGGIGSRALTAVWRGDIEKLSASSRVRVIQVTVDLAVASRPPRVPGAQHVSAESAAKHVAALRAAGMSPTAIHAKTGVSRFTLARLEKMAAENHYGVVPYGTAETLKLLQVPHNLDEVVKVPSIGTARRVQVLFTLGWTQSEMFRWLKKHHPKCGPRVVERMVPVVESPMVTRACHNAVVDMYSQLVEMSPTLHSRRVCLACLEEWGHTFTQVFPYQWEDLDIDDPKCSPAPPRGDEWHIDGVLVNRAVQGNVPWSMLLSTAERGRVVGTLTGLGVSVVSIARTLRTATQSVERYLGDSGRQRHSGEDEDRPSDRATRSSAASQRGSCSLQRVSATASEYMPAQPVRRSRGVYAGTRIA